MLSPKRPYRCGAVRSCDIATHGVSRKCVCGNGEKRDGDSCQRKGTDRNAPYCGNEIGSSIFRFGKDTKKSSSGESNMCETSNRMVDGPNASSLWQKSEFVGLSTDPGLTINVLTGWRRLCNTGRRPSARQQMDELHDPQN